MPDEGIYVATASHPAGKWSEPHLLQAGRGLIDPCPLWDDDGKAYLVCAYAYSRSGLKHMLRVSPMAPDGSKLLGEGEIVFHDPQRHPTLEGPKFLKRDGWYYILAPAGGVETGWQVALRSRNIFGPYEDKIVLAQGDTDVSGPHQGALVDTPQGGWWFIHFQDAGVYGRITHLQPVHWKDGWPLMGKDGQPVRGHAKPAKISGQQPCAPQTSDEFDRPQLGLQWQWHANHSDNWYSLTARSGSLRLYPQLARGALNQQPNFLLQKFPARSFAAETALELFTAQSGEEAGLVLMGESHSTLAVVRDGAKNFVVLRDNGDLERAFETTAKTIKLRVEVMEDGEAWFSFSEGSEFVALPKSVQARKGVWIGAKLGLYSLKRLANVPAGHADFEYFRFT
jgi:beta-xylosidase